MAWQQVVRAPGAGEQILFKVGLMTFKASSADTDGQFALIETVLPPDASVELHSHIEAEWWYVLEGAFSFTLGNAHEKHFAERGSFVCAPPHVLHAYSNVGRTAGRLLGMLLPGGDGGLETFFRQVGLAVHRPEDVPDLNEPVERLAAFISARRAEESR